MFTFSDFQTKIRQAFDPETISVVVGKVHDSERRFRIVIRDELAKAEHVFHVGVETTEEELTTLINEAGAKLGLVKGPSAPGTVGGDDVKA